MAAKVMLFLFISNKKRWMLAQTPSILMFYYCLLVSYGIDFKVIL